MKKLLIAALLLSGSQLLAAQPLSKAKGVWTKAKHAAVATGIGLSLLVSPVAQAEVGDWFDEVSAADAAYFHSVLLLRANNADSDLGFQFVHVGTNENGDSVIIGRDILDFKDVQNFLDAEADHLELYAWDGMIAEGISATTLKIFKDKTDGIFNVIALTVNGLNLSDDYSVAQVEAGYPYETEEQLDLVTYRLAYGAPITEAEREVGGFPLYRQECMTMPNERLAAVRIGQTTCGFPEGAVGLGSPLFRNGKFVAVQSRPAGRTDMQAWLAAGLSDEIAQFVANLNQGTVTAVHPADKVATTWGSLKKNR